MLYSQVRSVDLIKLIVMILIRLATQTLKTCEIRSIAVEVDSRANLQATQHEDAGQHNLLHRRKLKSLNHNERHTQDYDVKPHMSAGYSSIIGLQVETLVCEGVLGIPDS